MRVSKAKRVALLLYQSLRNCIVWYYKDTAELKAVDIKT